MMNTASPARRKKLFVTQSALNQQLLHGWREGGPGAPLFHRSKMNLRPTEIGQVYLDNAREILRIKQRTYNLINDMTDAKKGRLSIGFTPGRGSEMFTHVYPAFHQAYPNVVVEPHGLQRTPPAADDRQEHAWTSVQTLSGAAAATTSDT
ncbi:MAG: hypothetical protein ACLUD2_03810 [Clostridium sp.]